MRYVSIDLETTGLNPLTCDIVEFAAVLDDLKNKKPLEELPRYSAYILPRGTSGCYKGEPFALSMHPRIFRRIADREAGYRYLTIEELMPDFYVFLSQNGYTPDSKNNITITPAGKNFGMFDMHFLRTCILNWGNVIIRHRAIDPAMFYMQPDDDDKLPDSALCMKRAGLEGEVAHTALDDALMVVRLIRHGLK